MQTAIAIDSPHSDLENVHAGLELRMVDGCLYFDRPTFVRQMSTATLRGISGHAVRKFDPVAFDRFFKPSPHEDLPPAYAFQPIDRGGRKQNSVRFRVVSWDRNGEWIESLQQAMWMAKGIPYGTGGARVREVDWHEVRRLKYHGDSGPGGRVVIRLKSPLQLRKGRQRIDASALSAGQIVHACVNRVNLLSRTHGNGIQLDPLPYYRDALDMREVHRNLREVTPVRISSTQDRSIHLSGILGCLILAEVSSRLMSLFSVGQVLQIGRHTPEGCGLLNVDYCVQGSEGLKFTLREEANDNP